MASKARVTSYDAYLLIVTPHAISRARERHETLGKMSSDEVGRLCAEAVHGCPAREALVLPTDNRPQHRQVGIPFSFQSQVLGYLILDQDRQWSGRRAVVKTFITMDAWQVRGSFEAPSPQWYLDFREAVARKRPYPEKT